MAQVKFEVPATNKKPLNYPLFGVYEDEMYMKNGCGEYWLSLERGETYIDENIEDMDYILLPGDTFTITV